MQKLLILCCFLSFLNGSVQSPNQELATAVMQELQMGNSTNVVSYFSPEIPAIEDKLSQVSERLSQLANTTNSSSVIIEETMEKYSFAFMENGALKLRLSLVFKMADGDSLIDEIEIATSGRKAQFAPPPMSGDTGF